MELTTKQVEHVAKLARIRLSEEEKNRLAKEMADITTFAEQLTQMQNRTDEDMKAQRTFYRQDEVQPSYNREALLKNAPFAI